MRRLVPLLALLLCAPGLAACTSTYHPEYHPVTVTSYEQHVVSAAGSPGAPAPAPVMRAPPPPQPPAPAPWSAWPEE